MRPAADFGDETLVPTHRRHLVTATYEPHDLVPVPTPVARGYTRSSRMRWSTSGAQSTM